MVGDEGAHHLRSIGSTWRGACSTRGRNSLLQQQHTQISDEMSSIPELFELVKALYQLGQELPHYLLVLSELAEPNLSQDLRTPILCKLFHEVPMLLSNITPLEFHKLIANVPQDAVTLRMLVNLNNISTIFQQLSCLQILQLTNNVIPPGPLSMQLEVLLVAQEHMKTWTPDTPGYLHDELANTSLELERKRLLELQPKLPWELLQFFMEVIKLPKNESLDFFKWFVQLNRERVYTLVQILQFEPIIILEYKRRLTLPSSNKDIPPPPPDNGPIPVETPPDMSLNMDNIDSFMFESPLVDIDASMTPDDQSLFPTDLLAPPSSPPQPYIPTTTSTIPGIVVPHASTTEPSLRISKQPLNQTVYQRILKPAPIVMLTGPGVQNGTVSNYFVEVTLVRSDSDVELGACIDGNKVERVSNGVFATFKKLKILSTSQQQGTLFRLKFVLKKYVGNVFQSIPGAIVFSDPIEVFSHTQYLNNRPDAPTSASVAEVLPSSGVAGTRVVILGTNFVNSPTLKIRFGNVEVNGFTFHERGTIICSVPPRMGPNTGPVPVQVTNDSVHWCDARVSFVYAG